MAYTKPQKKALVAFHDNRANDDYRRFFERRNFLVSSATSVEEMLTHMGIASDASPEARPSNHFDWYFMDTNLGFPNEPTCEPAARVYGHVRAQVTAREIGFMSFTGNINSEGLAKKARIPVLDKMDIDSALDLYKSIPIVRG